MKHIKQTIFKSKSKRIAVLLSILLACTMGLIGKIIFIYQSTGDVFVASAGSTSSRSEKSIVIEEDGKTWLWGGSENEHFDITNLILNPDQFHYGIGREQFPALTDPAFVTAEKANAWLPDEARILGVQVNNQVKVYPIDLLIRHEVVNDTIAGHPIAACYCILADLGAVYSRQYENHILTFALSGYTYFDKPVWDGRDAFVFWDRETESLWWPPIGKAVSGPLEGVQLKVLKPEYWAQTTWGEFKKKYPQPLVLQRNQGFTPPKDWPTFDDETIKKLMEQDNDTLSIAPRWGENPIIELNTKVEEWGDVEE